MSLVLRLGPGIKKINIALGKRKFETIDQLKEKNWRIDVKKTNNSYVNNTWAIEQYLFLHYNQEGTLKNLIKGHLQGEKNFYLQELRNLDSNLPTTSQPLKILSEKVKLRLGVKHPNDIAKKQLLNKGGFLLYKKTEGYLRGMGIEKMLAQAEFEIIDVPELLFKLGWKDYDQKRKMEKYIGNKEERKKHYTLLEKFTGAVYLQHFLNSKNL